MSSSAATCRATATASIWVRTGEEALVELERHPIRLVLLDIGLPGKDGFDVCRDIRARSYVPILMLTARDEEPDRIVGLEVGADDYITKPFSPRELVARMKAVLRRSEPQDRRDTFALGDVVLDRESHDVTVGGKPVELTAKEFELLAYFMANTGVARLARLAARPGVGPRIPRRNPDGRRARRPAPPQARTAGSDPHAPRRRLQGRRPMRSLRARLFAATLAALALTLALTIGIGAVLTRRQVDKSQVSALARRADDLAQQRRANVSYVNQNTLSGSVRILVEPRPQLAQYVANANKSSDGKTVYAGDHYLYSYRTIPSRGLLLLRPRACARPSGGRSCATCCSQRSPVRRWRRCSRS